MSEMAKTAREAMKKKVKRLVEQADPKAKVDGSSYTPPEMLDADVQTGMRPISRRQFRRGGVVTEGEAPKKRADKRRRRTRRDRSRDQYKNGGSTPLTSNSLVNKDMKEANEERDGKKHIGGLKKGGRAKRAAGGMGSMRIDPMQAMMAQNHPARRAKDEREQRVMRAGRKTGGRTGKAAGGVMEVLSPAYALYKNRDKDAVKGLSPIANMKRGGMAHSDVKKDVALIKKAVHRHEMAKHPGSKLTKLASGGYASGGMPKDDDKYSANSKAYRDFAENMPFHLKPRAEQKRISEKRKRNLPPADPKWSGPSEAPIPGMKVRRASGGTALSGQMQGTRPTGGRIARKDGGTVTNIYFDTKKGAEGPPGGLMPPPMPPMPPLGGPPGAPPGAPPGLPPGGPPMPPPHMGPPPGGPPGLPPGGPPGGPPMMRRAGGRVGHRTYRKPQDMDSGAGSGLGRLEKIQIQKGK